jgi:hypothetical protein
VKIKLKKDIIENNLLNNDAVMSYVGVVSSHIYGIDETFTNKDMINFCLTKTHSASKRFEESIRNGLKQLIDTNTLLCKEKTGINYYLDSNNITLAENDKFIFADLEDVNKIMNSYVQGKSGMLRLYLCMLGTFIGKNHIKDIRDPEKYNNILGMMSQDYLAEMSHISKSSVVEYIKELENLEIIYVSRCSFKFKDKTGKIKRHNNIYGKYSNKELIDEFANIRYSMYDDLHKEKKSNIVNNARSLTQKYNYLRGGTIYDKKTVETIYNYVCDYNNKHPKKQKDMTPFVKYGYKVDNTQDNT